MNMNENSIADSTRNQLPNSDDFDLSALVDTVLQRIWLVVGCFAVITILGLGYVILATPIYRADALIQVEDKKSSNLGGLQEIADALGSEASPVTGEIEILRSREVVMKAVAATKADLLVTPKRFPIIGDWLARGRSSIEPTPSFLGLSSYAWGGETLQLDELSVPEIYWGETFNLIATETGYQLESPDGQVLIESGREGVAESFNIGGAAARIVVSRLSARPGTEFELTRASPTSIYRSILGSLTIGEVGKQSSVIRMSFDHSNVAFAQKLVNAIATAYLTQNVERRSAEADQSLRFLDSQLPEIKKNVERSENALNDFRTKTNTVSVEKSTDALLQQAVEAEKTRIQLEMKRDELQQRYRPDHPALRAIQSQLGMMAQRTGEVNELVNRLPVVQRDLLRLQRDVEVNNQLYIALLNSSQQLKVAKAGTIGNVRIIDFAVQDKAPVEPKKLIIVAIAALFGLLLGVGAAFVARALRPTIRDISEIERLTGLTAYASIPESDSQHRLDSDKRDRKGKQLVVAGRNQLLAALQPEDPAIESLRSLRTGLVFATMGSSDKNIVITGATAALGKSFVSANLAALLAIANKKVLLVETDMRRPQLGAYFGYRENAGLSDLLVGSKTLEDVLFRDVTGISGLDVLPSGQIPPNPGELLLSDGFAALLESVQDRYDHIILDSAPVLPVGDTLAVARLVSTIFMVVRAEVSTANEVVDAIRKLESSGTNVKGLIFNGVKKRRVGYGYAYRYYYGYGTKN